MAMGAYLSEEIKYDAQTGALLTKNTWVSLLPQLGA